MQLRIRRHQPDDGSEVIVVDSGLELPGAAERFHVCLQARPAREPVLARDAELRLRQGVRAAGLVQIARLILQVAQIGPFGERSRRRLR
jgi:hypothetical protein